MSADHDQTADHGVTDDDFDVPDPEITKTAHPTGDDQAAKNKENDPPA